MKQLTAVECIPMIKAVKKNWKKSLISIIDIQQYPEIWYRIITFKYKSKVYEYRESAADSWIRLIPREG